ncbi:PREDICTED: RING-H2 finger protein ATL7-like [Lupinus angustifolius]|uniref:RING-H2 finger protein ATL7-like n=1 Tax=Lupinus angustifolius TaxID=3871 RepID=UPI00092EAD86|nr:PREDICTED: RING-H2 finger protein ATL7-like [Lupinus angustifolius]
MQLYDQFVSQTCETNNNTVVMSLPSSNHSIDLGSFDLDEALAVAGESCRQLAVSKTIVLNLPAAEEVMTEEDVCSICMEGFRSNNTNEGNKKVPCGHVYHSNCITLWLCYSNSCPICRSHIYPSPSSSIPV